jgi:hypothetical protein
LNRENVNILRVQGTQDGPENERSRLANQSPYSFVGVICFSISHEDSAIVQAVRLWLVTVKPCVQYRVTSRDVFGGRNGTAAGNSPSFFDFFPCHNCHCIIDPYLSVTSTSGVR